MAWRYQVVHNIVDPSFPLAVPGVSSRACCAIKNARLNFSAIVLLVTHLNLLKLFPKDIRLTKCCAIKNIVHLTTVLTAHLTLMFVSHHWCTRTRGGAIDIQNHPLLLSVLVTNIWNLMIIRSSPVQWLDFHDVFFLCKPRAKDLRLAYRRCWTLCRAM